MAGKSKKGGAYERRLCETLSSWWAEDPDVTDLFWRASMSGGRATVRGRKGKTTTGHYGDIAATDDRGLPLMRLLVVESKRGYNKDANFHSLFDRPATARPQMYEEWIDQAKASAALARTPYWLIVHKRDQRDPLVVFPMALYDALSAAPDGAKLSPLVLASVRLKSGRERLAATTLASFLAAVKPAKVKQVLALHTKGKK